MSSEGSDLSPGGQAPELHLSGELGMLPRTAAGGEKLAVGREGDDSHLILMPWEGSQLSSARSVPELDGSIFAP
jgi:hypothetical protein